jgi:V/A-type H+-transporting ATPase subunit B
MFPKKELNRIDEDLIEDYYREDAETVEAEA